MSALEKVHCKCPLVYFPRRPSKSKFFCAAKFKLTILRRGMGLKCHETRKILWNCAKIIIKKVLIIPVSRSKVKKMRRFSKKLRSHATSRPQFLDALSLAMHVASCLLIPSHRLIILSYCLIIAHRDTPEEEALIQKGKFFTESCKKTHFCCWTV